MDCTELARVLPAFADGEFVGDERAEVEVHLAHCETCRTQVSSETAFHALLHSKAGRPSQAPAALRRRIEQDLGRERLRNQAVSFASYAAMATGLVVVASAGYVIALPPRSTTEQLIAEAVRKSLRDLPQDATPLLGDEAPVHNFLHRQFDSYLPVPRFHSPDAPHLVGARLASMQNHDAAEFTYGGDPAHHTTLLVFQGNDVDLAGAQERIGSRDVLLANHNGYNVALWKRGEIVYSLVTDVDESDVRRLIQEVEDR